MKREDKPEIHTVDIDRLKQTLRYVIKHSKFYKKHLENMDIQSVRSFEDFQKLPFVNKADLTTHTKDFWCVDAESIVDYCSTSGSEGRPMTIPLTDVDMDRLAENEAGSFGVAGLGNKDIIQLCTTVDKRFMAGLAYILGARKLGVGMVRSGPGLPEYQWRSILEIKPSTLIVVPSFLVKMLQYAEEMGIDPYKTSVKRAICIGESIRNPDFTLNALGARINAKWKIDLHSTYASSEMQTAFTECTMSQGGHYNSDLIFPEIVDEKGEVLLPGNSGELVITTFGVEGLPLLRYKTGDITCLHAEICDCGHSSMRIGPIQGRKNQMIKVKGTSCYPPALIEVLNGIPKIESFQIQVYYNDLGNDVVSIYINADSDLSEKSIADTFRSRVRFAPEIIRMKADEIQEMVLPEDTRKAILFKDLRS